MNETIKPLIIGIMALAIGIYIFRGREKRAERETFNYDATARWNNNIEALGICALFIGIFSLFMFFYRLLN